MLVIAITIVIIFMFLGTPIFVIFALLGSIIGLWLLGLPPAALAEIMYSGVNVWVLVAVPFFILAGNFMVHGGLARRIFDCVDSFVGHFPGGLAISVIGACTVFAAISGSSLATASAIGSISLPSMSKSGYPSEFNTGLIAVSGTLGNLIPPSIYLIILGSVLNLSVGQLFMAGVLPGLLYAFFIAITASGISFKRKYAIKPAATWKTRGKAFIPALPAFAMPVIVLGGIYGGIFTPTEAAAIAVLFSFLVGQYIYRELNKERLWQSLANTMNTTCMVYFLIGMAVLMNKFFSYTNLPQKITALVVGNALTPITYLMMASVLLMAFGCFLDALPIIYICAPLLFPPAVNVGIDPMQFCIIMTTCLMIGQVTPPVGLVLYGTASFSGESADTVIRGSIPFLLAMVAGLLVVVIWPALSMFLPSLMR
jgi:C4-dicarboxylate transporter DctM subunit